MPVPVALLFDRVIRDFDQVAVRIAQVSRNNIACSSGPVDRAFNNIDALLLALGYGLRNRCFDNKTKIGAALPDILCPGFKLLSQLMQVDFLLAENQRDSTFAKLNFFSCPGPGYKNQPYARYRRRSGPGDRFCLPALVASLIGG